MKDEHKYPDPPDDYGRDPRFNCTVWCGLALFLTITFFVSAIAAYLN